MLFVWGIRNQLSIYSIVPLASAIEPQPQSTYLHIFVCFLLSHQVACRAQLPCHLLCRALLRGHPSAVLLLHQPVQSHLQLHHKATVMRTTDRRTKKISPTKPPTTFRHFKFSSRMMSTDRCPQTSHLFLPSPHRPKPPQNTCGTQQNPSLPTSRRPSRRIE